MYGTYGGGVKSGKEEASAVAEGLIDVKVKIVRCVMETEQSDTRTHRQNVLDSAVTDHRYVRLSDVDVEALRAWST
jgi:hypothetical protein